MSLSHVNPYPVRGGPMYDKTLLSGSRSIRCLSADILDAARDENVPNELIQKHLSALNDVADSLTRLHVTINEVRVGSGRR